MSEETPLARAVEYLFSLKYSWEQRALLAVVDLIDQILTADEDNTERLYNQLELYRSGARQIQGHHPDLTAKIFSAIAVVLSGGKDAVDLLLREMARYSYLAVKLIGWLGPQAEAALPTLIANAN